MTNSFYGGIPGQPFRIKKIFSNYAELQSDLNKIWKSSIGVGEYVIVSYYGDSDSADYETYLGNKKADKEAGYTKNYNGCLFQKYFYADSAASTGGIGYKEISCLAGPYPELNVLRNILNADKAPTIDIHTSDYTINGETVTASVNSPVIEFGLPRSQNIQIVAKVVSSDESVDYNFYPESTDDSGTITINEEDYSYDINTPLLVLTLPQNVNVHFGTDIPDTDGYISSLSNEENLLSDLYICNSNWTIYKITEVLEDKVKVTLETKIEPLALSLSFTATDPYVAEYSSSGILASWRKAEPSASISEAQIDETTGKVSQTLTLKIPKQTPIETGTITTLAPAKAPSASITNVAPQQYYELNFSLPRAVKFIAGDKEKFVDPDCVDEDIEFGVGDIFIDTPTGMLYSIDELGFLTEMDSGSLKGPKGDTGGAVEIAATRYYEDITISEAIDKIWKEMDNTTLSHLTTSQAILVNIADTTAKTTVSYFVYELSTNNFTYAIVTGSTSIPLTEHSDSSEQTYAASYINSALNAVTINWETLSEEA